MFITMKEINRDVHGSETAKISPSIEMTKQIHLNSGFPDPFEYRGDKEPKPLTHIWNV